MGEAARWNLRIDGALDLRDVGGLPCREGGSTRHGVLLRTGSLRRLTDADARVFTTVLDVGTVVDLRSARELAADGPSVLARAGVPTVHLHLHLPLAPGDRAAPAGSADPRDPAAALRRTYQDHLDERGHHIATAARLVAGSDRAVLLHCAAGRDGTGVAVALLLDAVGVERSAVVVDHAATDDVIEQAVRESATQEGRTVDGGNHPARSAVLGDLLDGVDREHGGAGPWLRAHGLTDADLAALRHRLVQTPSARPPGPSDVPRNAGRAPSSPPSR